MICSLPLDIFRMILQYLTLPDIGRMDMAVLNHQWRHFFITALEKFIIPEYQSLDLFFDDMDPLVWIVRRKICCQNIAINCGKLSQLSLILNSRASVVSLRFIEGRRMKGRTSEFLSEIGCCPSLRNVEMSYVTNSPAFKAFFDLNTQLQRVSLHSIEEINLPLLLINLKNLQYLNLSDNHWFNDRCLERLAEANLLSELTEFNISNTGVVEDQSGFYLMQLPHLQSINWANCSFTKDVSITCLHRIILPSLLSTDPNRQLAALQCLGDNSFVVGDFLFDSCLLMIIL